MVSFSLLCSLFACQPGAQASAEPPARKKPEPELVLGVRDRPIGGGGRALVPAPEDGYRTRCSKPLCAIVRRSFRRASLALLGSLLLAPMIGTELMPPTDEGEVRIEGEMEVGTRLELVDAIARDMETIVVSARARDDGQCRGSQQWPPRNGSRGRPPTERADPTTRSPPIERAPSGRFAGMEVRARGSGRRVPLDRLGGEYSGIEIEAPGLEPPVRGNGPAGRRRHRGSPAWPTSISA